MKVLSGVYPAGTFDGEIVVDGETRRFRNVHGSEDAGISIIFQELSLVPEMSVGENIFLGREPSRFGVVDWRQLYHRSAEMLQELGLDIDPRRSAGGLSIGQQQLVEIAKALSRNARILVLDEPTAALTGSEVETLFGILRCLLERGVGMVYISHKLDEVFTMADRITVLRDGRTVASFERAEATKGAVIKAMVGREVDDIFPVSHHTPGETAFAVRDLTAYSHDGRKVVDGVSFHVQRGEVLGIAGLMGAGRSELLAAIFGSWPGRVSGEISVDRKSTRLNSSHTDISRMPSSA